MPNWSFEIADTATGARQAFTSPQGPRLTRRRSAASQLGLNVLPTDAAIAELSVADRAVRAYRDGVLRFYGQIQDPLTIDADGAQVQAGDPFYFLGLRRLQAEVIYGNTDLSDIAWNLIALEDARKPVHLRRGATSASVKADVIFPDGSVTADLITGLNERDQGIWFWIDPVDGVPGTLGELRTAWPDAGVLRPAARFEFGAGTMSNLDGYSVKFDLPRNGVRAFGASIGNAALVPARRDDAASQTRFGLMEDDFSFTDIDDSVSLDKHALDQIHPWPPVTVTFSPKPYDPEASNDVEVPTLFDDFDAGDIVPVLIRDEHFTLQGTVRLGEATIAIADDAESEQLESLVGNGYAQLVDGVWQVTP